MRDVVEMGRRETGREEGGWKDRGRRSEWDPHSLPPGPT